MLTAFVTGATGFLGAALARHLLQGGFEVRALVRSGARGPLLDVLPVERITGDLMEPDIYARALKGCHVLFHTAAGYTHDPARIADMEAVNGEGARRVLAAGWEAGVPCLVHTSTIGTVGQPEDGSLATEDAPFNLPNPTAYVRSKLEGERHADALARAGAPMIIVHPTAMLGTGDWRPTASGRRVLDVLSGRTLRYPAGSINWCPVDDVAQGMILAAQRGQPGRHYILGHSGGNLSADAFVRLIRQAAGMPAATTPAGEIAATKERLKSLLRLRPATPIPDAAAGAAPDRLTCDPNRAVTELGMPQSSLEAAARAEVEWFREAGMAPG